VLAKNRCGEQRAKTTVLERAKFRTSIPVGEPFVGLLAWPDGHSFVSPAVLHEPR